MDREEANRALELLSKVAARARDDTALDNWGIIWLLSSFSNGAGFIGTHVLLNQQYTTPGPFVLLWLGVFIYNGIVLVVFRPKGRENRTKSFLEQQIWSLFNTLVVGMAVLAVVNYIMGLHNLFMPAVAAILVAATFSSMGSLLGAWWYLAAAGWLLLSLVMALLSHHQFLIFGISWFLTQGTAGAIIHRVKQQRVKEQP